MRKLLFISLLAFSCLLPVFAQQVTIKDTPSSSATEGRFYYGHCSYNEPDLSKGLTYDANAVLQLFARMPRSKMRVYEGSRVTGVRVALCKEEPVKVFLKDKINGPFIRQKDVVLRPGWNEVIFDDPYTIGDAELSFGYQHECQAGDGNVFSRKPPVYAVEKKTESSTSDAYYWIYNDNSPSSVVESTGYILMLQLIIEPAPENTKNMSMIGELLMPQAKEKDKTSTVSFTYRNTGTNSITSTVFEYVVGSNSPQTVTLDQPLAPQASRLVTLRGLQAEKGDNFSVKLTSVNGKAVSPEQKLEATFDILERVFPKKVLLEQFTTEKCGQCPKADAMLHNAVSKHYEGRVAWVAHHTGYHSDFLTLPGSVKLEFLYGEGAGTYCPAMGLDRVPTKYIPKYKDKPLHPASFSREEAYVYLFDEAFERLAPLSVELTPTINDDRTEITANVRGELDRTSVNPSELFLYVWLVEDFIEAENQYGVASGVKFKHMNAVRHMATPEGGLPLSVDGDAYNMSVTIPISNNSDWDTNHLRVVAFVSKGIANKKDLRVYNADDKVVPGYTAIHTVNATNKHHFFVENGTIVAEGFTPDQIKVYTIDGHLVPNSYLHPATYIVLCNDGYNRIAQKIMVP